MGKENDLFLNLVNNPTFSAYDFKVVGLDASNTSLESKDKYKRLEFVKTNPMFQTNGKFDETKFDNAYNTALTTYNQMARNEVAEEIGRHANFFRDNFYVPLEQRNLTGPEFVIYKTPNPMRNQLGLIRNEIIENPQSVREIAQTMKVWDYANNKWIESPDDMSIFSSFANTLVLAQWDEDGEHKDPFTGQMVKHKKGEKKLNAEGTYYYETLGGRSIYGREVLSKWDTLGSEGSFIDNVFGNDGKESNLFATLFRDALKVIPAFIPYVNTYYIGARVAMNLAEMASIGGEMITNNQSSLFNGLHGYFKSLEYSSSDADASNAWSLANLVNMGSDVFLQLAEQRWIFQRGASLFKKGKYGVKGSELMETQDLEVAKAAEKKFLQGAAEESRKLNLDATIDAVSRNAGNVKRFGNLGLTMSAADAQYAEEMLRNYLTDYRNVGKYLSMTYMTGVTVQDSYGEAIQQGASRLEAALLTLGYAIGEFAIINSDLGKWILPELKGELQMWKQIGSVLEKNGLSEAATGIKNTTDKKKLADWAGKIIGFGKKEAMSRYDKLKGTSSTLKLATTAMVSNALGEGFEETSEELLYDITKTLANLGYRLAGSDTQLTAWDNIPSRYALSFVGGVIGGGLGQARSEFRNAAALQAIDVDQAYSKLVDIVREHREDEFLKVVNGVSWAPSKLSTIRVTQDNSGNNQYDVVLNDEGNYKPLEEGEISQDDFVKQTLVDEVTMIKKLLNAEGADLSDDAMISKLKGFDVKGSFRALDIKKSTVLKGYIDSYHQAVNNLIAKKRDLIQLTNPGTDSEERKNEKDLSVLENISILNTEIKKLREEVQSYFDGTKSVDFMQKALFEMSWASKMFANTSLVNYLEFKYSKPVNELTDLEFKDGQEEYVKLKKLQGKEFYDALYTVFLDANIKASDFVALYEQKYFDPNSTIGLLTEYIQSNILENNLLGQQNGEALTENVEGTYGASSITIPYRAEYKLLQTLASKYSKDESVHAILNEINNVNTPLSAAQYYDKIIQVAAKLFNDPEVVDNFIQEIKQQDYITAGVRELLINIISQFKGEFSSGGALNKIFTEIQKKPYSPVLEFLDKVFSIGLNTQTRSAMKPSQLIKTLEQRLIDFGKSDNIKEFGFEANEELAILEAIDFESGVFEMGKALLEAMSTGSADFGDMFGLNVTINEINPDAHLATISANTANSMLQEIDMLKQRLLYYKLIIDTNSDNKLNQHTKMDTVANTILFDTFFNRFVDANAYPPDEFEGVSELKATFNDNNNFTILKKLRSGEIKSVSREQLIDFHKELKLFRETIHNFFEANKSLLENDTEENIEKLSRLLDPAVTGIYQMDDEILNLDSKTVSNSSFMWYFASLAAIDPTKFMASYAKTLKDSDGNFLLLPVAGQEINTMIAFAAITNGKAFGIFAKAYNKALTKYADTLSEDELEDKFKLSEDIKNLAGTDSRVSINFLRTILVEGIAGSGKSSGVARAIIRMLAANKDTKDLLKGIWIVHTSSENAETLAKNLFGENYKEYVSMFLSHKDLMKKISGTNAQTGRSWNEHFNSNNTLIVDTQDLETVNGVEQYNFGINKSIEKPKLIITDEVSHLSNLSLRMIDQFAEFAECSHLTFGDFDQSGVYGKRQDGDTTVTYSAYNTNFIHGPKLGQSLRSDSRLKDINNALVRKAINDAVKNGAFNTTKIELLYYEDKNTPLIGDKIIDIDDVRVGELGDDDLETQIRRLLDTTIAEGENEKLGYVYDDEANNPNRPSSQVTKILEKLNQEEKYKGRIDFRKGNSAQGFENLYYIVNLLSAVNPSELKNNGPGRLLLKDFYTGFTRSKRGTLIIGSNISENLIQQSTLINYTGTSLLSEASKRDFIDRKYNVYKEVYGDIGEESLPYKPWTNGQEQSPQESNPKQLLVGTFVTNGENTFEITKYENDKVFLKNIESGEIIEVDLTEFADKFQQISNPSTDEEVTKMNQKNLNPEVGINNSNSEVTEMMGHTFNALDEGLTEDGKFGKYALYRYDNLIGIAKYLGIDVTLTLPEEALPELKNVLDLIRSIVKHGGVEYKSFEEAQQYIIDAITDVLTKYNEEKALPEGTLVRTIYKISRRADNSDSDLEALMSKDPKGRPFNSERNKARYFVGNDEKVDRIIDDDKHALEPVNGKIYMLLLDKAGNTIFEISLATDTNPFTLAFTRGFGEETIDGEKYDISKEAESIRLAHPNDYAAALKELRNALETKLSKHSQAKKLLRQIDIFEAVQLLPTGGNVKYLRNSKGEWLLPGRDWQNSGIIIDTDISKTIVDPSLRVEYEGQSVSYKALKDSGKFKLSDHVFITRHDHTIVQANGRTIEIKAGHPFILASDFVYARKNASDQTLYELLLSSNKSKSLANCDVTVVYVQPPTKPFNEYVKHLASIWAKKHKSKKIDIYDRSFKTVTTSYRVVKELLNHEDWLRNRMKELYPENSEQEIQKDIENIRNIVEQFKNLEEGSEDTKELIDALTSEPLSSDPNKKVALEKENIPRLVTTFGVQSNFVGFFDKIIVSLTLGQSDVSGDKYIKFINPDNASKVINDMYETCLKDYFKYGFFTHVGISKDEKGVQEINVEDGPALIVSTLNVNDARCNGTLVTSAYQIIGEEAVAYLNQREEVRSYTKNKKYVKNGVTVLVSHPDSTMYESEDAKDRANLINTVINPAVNNPIEDELKVNNFLQHLINSGTFVSKDIITKIRKLKITNDEEFAKQFTSVIRLTDTSDLTTEYITTESHLRRNSKYKLFTHIFNEGDKVIGVDKKGNRHEITFTINKDGEVEAQKSLEIKEMPVAEDPSTELITINKDVLVKELTSGKPSLSDRLKDTLLDSVLENGMDKEIEKWVDNVDGLVTAIILADKVKLVKNTIGRILKNTDPKSDTYKLLKYIQDKLSKSESEEDFNCKLNII